MNSKPLLLSFCLLGLTGMSNLLAAGEPVHEAVTIPYDVMDPSIKVAKSYQKRGDCETAVQLYDAVLERNPTDQQALKSLVQCYKALETEGQEQPAAVQKPKTGDDDSLSDLPNLVPADSTNAQETTQKKAPPVL
jgi:hypothetical protein